MSDLSWEKALRVPDFSVTPETKDGGWPGSFSVWHIARLQYAREGTEAEKSKATRNQYAIADAMVRAIEAGDLPAEQHSRTATVQAPQRKVSRSQYLRRFASREWYERDDFRPPPPPLPRQVAET